MKIEVIIWDVDGTLWRNEKLSKIIGEYFIDYLSKFLKISRKKAKILFFEGGKKWYSWSKTVANFCGVDEKKLILEIEEKINKSLYLKEDIKLIKTFISLKNYRHLILTNGSYNSTLLVLKKIGFSSKKETINGQKYTGSYRKKFDFFPFEQIFSSDKLSAIKPEKIVFKKILDFTGLPADRHLMIGDSAYVDLYNAKKIGMKTCLVYSNNANYYNWVDFYLPDVYSVPLIFNKKIFFLKIFKKIESLIKKILI